MALEEYSGDVEMCCRCSACKFVPMQKIKGVEHSYACPSIAKYNFHAYSGGGRLTIARSMLQNGFVYSDKLLDIVKNCMVCGACDISCKYAMDMEVLLPINEFRIKCVENGHTVPALDETIAGLRASGSMVRGKGKRSAWAEGSGIKDATKEKVDVYFHVGCVTSYDKTMHKLASATAGILKKAGVDFGIGYENETCCGGRAFQMGYKEDFLRQAKKNMEMLRNAGVKTLITGCADGYHAFKVLYDRYNLKGDLEVLHTSEYFARLIAEGRLQPRKKLNMAVTYHDPCHLGRLGEPWIHWEGKKIPGHRFVFDPPKKYRRGTHGVYQQPRDILNAIHGVKLLEMDRIKEYAWCCGAGGGVNESNPEFSMWTALERIREAEATGAEAIATACPWCEKNFSQAVEAGGSRMKVYDIVELVEQAL